MRVFFAFAVCALPLLLVSCTKVDKQDQQVAELTAESTVDDPAVAEAAVEAVDDVSIEPDPPGPVVTNVEPTPTPKVKVEDRTSSAASRAKGEINFDDLKFELAKDAPFEDAMLTDAIRALEGTKVKLRGYILPSTLFSETNISQFVLVRDNQECCFGPGAALFDCVMVQMVAGKTTDFVTRPITVEGTFVIDTISYRYPPGLSPTGATHMAVFRIEGESVQ